MLVNVPYLGDDVVLPGDGYLSMFESTLPAIPGLVGAYLFGGDVGLGKNVATGEIDAAIIGAPVQQDGYAVLDGSNFLQTEIMDSDAMSLFVFGRNPEPGSAAAYLGNLAGASGVSSGIAVSSSNGADFGSNLVRNSAWTTVNVTADPGVWFLNSARGASGAVTKTNSWLRNVVAQGTNTNPRTLGVAPIRIGRAYTNANVGPVHLSSAVIVQGNVSDADAQKIVDWMDSYARTYKLIA